MTILICLLAALSARSEVGLGADYSSQQYAVITGDTLGLGEDDTLDIETEARAFWNADLRFERGGIAAAPATVLTGDNALGFSTASLSERLELGLEQRLAPALRLSASNEANLKYHHRLLPAIADTSYRPDYWSNTGRIDIELDATDALAFTIAERFELHRYPRPDSFSSDYALNEVKAGMSRDFGVFSGLDADYSWSRRWSADPAQVYGEHAIDLSLDAYLDNGPDIRLENSFGRRGHTSRERSFWEENPGLTVDFDFTEVLGLGIDNESRWTWHDSTSDVYRDGFENNLKLTGSAQIGTDITVRIAPQFDFATSLPAPTDDDFRELSVGAGVDLLRAGRFWLSVEDRLGRRRYPLADSSFQSNYTFNELNLFVNWTILATRAGALTLDGMVSLAPEWHATDAEDFTTRIVTFELKYGF